MIHVETLRVHEFRGIRDQTLTLNNKNFAISGPNGTGKSGVVDALEFVLSGTISRLSGRGRGELSIKTHGPHVDCGLPEEAWAEAVLRVPSLGKTLTIRRSVKAPSAPEITPDTVETRNVLAYLEAHPEFALSRREITSFVLAEPSSRSKQIQELLKLDRINDLRLRFQKIAKDAVTRERTAAQAQATAAEAFGRAFDLSTIAPAAALAAVNALRAALGLAPVAAIGDTTMINAGVTDAKGPSVGPVNKAVAASDLQALRDMLAARSGAEFETTRVAVLTPIQRLQSDASLLNAVVRDDFLKAALELFDGEHCPACDAPYAPEDFTAIIAGKRDKLVEVKALRAKAETGLAPIIAALEAERDILRTVWPHAKALKAGSVVDALTAWGTALGAAIDGLKAFLPLDKTLEILAGLPDPEPLAGVLDDLGALVTKLPEPSAQAAAAATLGAAQERLDAWRTASGIFTKASAEAKTAGRVSELYAAETEAALEDVYLKVQTRFADLYRQLNADDEGAFEAEMKQDKASLAFKVDFYRRGKFPPGAYHSEGHQDSMGLCLYLALMDHLQGPRFTFAVFDDVLMSVDTGHRREVTRMLTKEFPNTQFVLTTHDPVWLKFMQTAGLVPSNNVVRFRKWSVETGPSVWVDNDVWAEIEAAVGNDNIREAAAQLRNYLEYISGEAAQAFRAKVIFNADGQYDLGDLLAPAVNRLRELYADAIKAAETWGDQAKTDAIKVRKQTLEAAYQATQAEQWMINPAVHYNEWATFHQKDLSVVVAAFKALAAEFHCAKCNCLLEVKPPKGSKEHLLCVCGAASLSFASKAKAPA